VSLEDFLTQKIFHFFQTVRVFQSETATKTKISIFRFRRKSRRDRSVVGIRCCDQTPQTQLNRLKSDLLTKIIESPQTQLNRLKLFSDHPISYHNPKSINRFKSDLLTKKIVFRSFDLLSKINESFKTQLNRLKLFCDLLSKSKRLNWLESCILSSDLLSKFKDIQSI